MKDISIIKVINTYNDWLRMNPVYEIFYARYKCFPSITEKLIEKFFIQNISAFFPLPITYFMDKWYLYSNIIPYNERLSIYSVYKISLFNI